MSMRSICISEAAKYISSFKTSW